jgi:eukaryotic-like serine/threonine-protein kinase
MITSQPLSVGSRLFGFELVAELGEGSFSRVYLARQVGLASRFVVLKILNSSIPESQILARLQHSNIVPIFSAHESEQACVICMPFLGATTFTHVFEKIRTLPHPPRTGKELVAILHAHKGKRGASGECTPSPEQTVRIRKETLTSTRIPSDLLGELPSLYPETTELLREIEKKSYVDSVLWLVAKLCEGLAHAHERGVIHRDIKPSNLIWAEDGQPMLLDFSLAHDRHLTGDFETQIGGTPGYMAPEQLAALQQGKPVFDPRSDIFSMGLILWQFLTFEKPCPGASNDDKTAVLLDRMIGLRNEKISNLASKNADVSPAVESIVKKCLEYDPAKRYQTANELREDLNRHLASLPLKHAPNRSLAELVRKWSRRHPRLSSSTTVATLALLLILGVTIYSFSRLERQERYEAQTTREAFRRDLDQVQFSLLAHWSDPETLDEAILKGREALARYGVLESAPWRTRPAFVRLEQGERDALRHEVGTLLFLLTRAKNRSAEKEPDPARRELLLREALDWNQHASAAFSDSPSGVFLRQRSELYRSVGMTAEANELVEQSKSLPPKLRSEKALTAREWYVRGRYQRALTLFQEVVREDPRDVFSLLLIARCRERQGHHREAVGAYSACIAVWPDAPQLYFNRGRANLHALDCAEAVRDFAESHRLDPSLTTARVGKALAHQGLGEHARAVEELDSALDEGCTETRIYFIRAWNREALGDRPGAERDRREGIEKVPTDEQSFLTRGFYLIGSAPEKALEDFNAALKINPRSEVALKNQAHVLAEHLGKTEAAIEPMTKLIEFHPEQPLFRADRGVLYARLGQSESARKEAAESLKHNPPGEVLYRVGCIHALLATTDDDRSRAVHYLSLALKAGFGAEHLAKDRDLDNLRENPSFRQLESLVAKLDSATKLPLTVR